MAPPKTVWAPALTKQAFRGIRPQGNYQHYLDYLKRKRGEHWDASRPNVRQVYRPPTPAAAGAGAGPGGVPTYASLLALTQRSFQTPAQIEAAANRMAQKQLDYQRTLLREEYGETREDAIRKMQLLQSAGRAAAAMNAGLIGQVGSQYQAGADQLSALASAGAAQMSGATDAAVAGGNAALSNVGMPGVTVGGPVGASGVAGATQAGVENYRGGTLPAGAMENAGGFAQAGAAGQIAAQNLRATQEASMGYAGAMHEADRNRARALREVVASRPATYNQFYTQLQDANRQQMALAMSLLGAKTTGNIEQKKLDQAIKQQRIENKHWGMEFNLEKDKIDAAAAAAGIDAKRIDASASRAYGYLVNKSGEAMRDKQGRMIPVASSGGTSGLTPGQTVSLMQKAGTAAEKFYYGTVVQNGKRIPATESANFDPNNSATWGNDSLDYAKAAKRLNLMGVPKSAALAILNEHYERGDSGRPLFSQAEEKQAKKILGARKFAKAKQQIDRLLSQAARADAAGNGDLAARLGSSADEIIAAVLAGGQGLPPNWG
jgi:hypothetical protein